MRALLLVPVLCLACTTADAAGNASQPLSASSREQSFEAWLLEWSGHEVRLVDRKRVAGALQQPKHPAPGSWRVDVLGEEGAVHFSTQLDAPNVVRGGEGEAGVVRQPSGRFQVKVPGDVRGVAAEVWAQRWTLEDGGSQEWVRLGRFELTP